MRGRWKGSVRGKTLKGRIQIAWWMGMPHFWDVDAESLVSDSSQFLALSLK